MKSEAEVRELLAEFVAMSVDSPLDDRRPIEDVMCDLAGERDGDLDEVALSQMSARRVMQAFRVRSGRDLLHWVVAERRAAAIAALGTVIADDAAAAVHEAFAAARG